MSKMSILFLVDFVLRDPRQTDDEAPEEELPHRQEIAILPKPWHSSFVQAQKFIEKNLHSINPAMAEVLSKWHKTIYKYSISLSFDVAKRQERKTFAILEKSK